MAPKRRTTRLNPSATPTPVTNTHTTTSVTNAQIQAMINEGVTAALAARDATRNGDDSHTSGTEDSKKDDGTDKYCPRGEIKKLEFEMWNLKVKGNDVIIDQVEKYVGGLPDTIHGSVMATKPKTMQDAIEFATELMDKKINT
ncbi:hypothetical protein Tco_1213714 [Tanacetum coccineum]